MTELLRANQNEPKGKMRPQLATLKSYIKRYRNAVFKVATKRGFFQNLEPIDYDGARQLMEDIYRLSGSKPHLLTAPVNTAYCASEKEWWAQHHFGGLYDEFYCTDRKQEKALTEVYDHEEKKNVQKQGLLIDDRIKYVSEFEKAGGLTIHHINHETTRKQLDELFQTLQTQPQLSVSSHDQGISKEETFISERNSQIITDREEEEKQYPK